MSTSPSKESRRKNVVHGEKYVKMTSPLSKTTEDAVRALAYEIYESKGRQDDRADQDWLQAERELLARKE